MKMDSSAAPIASIEPLLPNVPAGNLKVWKGKSGSPRLRNVARCEVSWLNAAWK